MCYSDSGVAGAFENSHVGNHVIGKVKKDITIDDCGTLCSSTALCLAIQYNSQSDQVLANLRFRYIYHPGSDLYVVYNERRVAERSDLIDRTVVVKITRMFRF